MATAESQEAPTVAQVMTALRPFASGTAWKELEASEMAAVGSVKQQVSWWSCAAVFFSILRLHYHYWYH